MFTVSVVIETKIAIGWCKLQLRMWFVELNYNFECGWLIELSDNDLASEFSETKEFFKLTTIEEIVIFFIIIKKKTVVTLLLL